ncbi:exported hypothetical protein [Actinacidiphila bryophytorum]|uniref:Uncharacterized protein n=1 Tax=Actinacidiphila bryophytorum TaxID=1436133 RepID=A0A9W4H8P4_9ACTN|nr:exported hypothetical protein [Actinacidiphila bryophytorum]
MRTPACRCPRRVLAWCSSGCATWCCGPAPAGGPRAGHTDCPRLRVLAGFRGVTRYHRRVSAMLRSTLATAAIRHRLPRGMRPSGAPVPRRAAGQRPRPPVGWAGERRHPSRAGIRRRDLRTAPAGHDRRRLPHARPLRRRRGRRPGGLAALGRHRPQPGARAARLPGAHHHAAGDRPAAARPVPARGLRRRVAAGTAHHRRRARRRVPGAAGRNGVAGDAGAAGVPDPAGARGVRAARGLRLPLRRDRRDPGPGRTRRTPARRARPAPCGGQGAALRRRPRGQRPAHRALPGRLHGRRPGRPARAARPRRTADRRRRGSAEGAAAHPGDSGRRRPLPARHLRRHTARHGRRLPRGQRVAGDRHHLARPAAHRGVAGDQGRPDRLRLPADQPRQAHRHPLTRDHGTARRTV